MARFPNKLSIPRRHVWFPLQASRQPQAISSSATAITPPSSPRFRGRLIYWPNGGGLSRSAQMVANVLRSAGWHIDLVENGEWLIPGEHWSSFHRKVRQSLHVCSRNLRNNLQGAVGPGLVHLGLRERWDLNIFLEHLIPAQRHRARKNVWIPNQEWMPRRPWRPHREHLDARQIASLDAIWAKTRYAESLFRNLTPKVSFVGFSSFDVHDPSVEKVPNSFVHVAGRSQLKGTAVVIEAWRRNPTWPRLVIIESPLFARDLRLPNVDYRAVRLPDTELRELQNRTEFHVYPSAAEGFGHAHCEALGMEGIVITTDAPPMNELVTAERGLLVAYDRTTPQGLGTNYHASVSALEAAVQRALAMTEAERCRLRRSARHAFLENDRSFKLALPIAAAGLVQDGGAV